ncbi:hypothetical protein [Pedobacter cryophilus]|uniref:Uncharacterized protein n=1 Tax=Pedobacter cryophilus TaxID=2571271 RepID=A0A4U1C2Z7_9SPHI|nr:hypothetical protein [Pedobacter cryophilus]TKC00140.1 hypothetical protein FA046_00200 [Pedobacter cryophilus]
MEKSECRDFDMMSFEEFFFKKKIDLIALAATKPDLFLEFKEHYALMGEKSFDHTKKYWFNQLRLSHKLSEEDEVQLKAALFPAKEVIANKQEQTEITTVTKAPGFKPRFKAPTTSSHPPVEKALEEPFETTEIPVTVTGFKPRFKATSTLVKQEEPETLKAEEEIKDQPKIPVTGFKPRFKAAYAPVKQEEPELTISVEEIKEETVKPIGFKPRFKAGSTPSKQEDKEN